ncbi:signal peptidase 22 kDa subunit, partial [Atractiella rhizophila]
SCIITLISLIAISSFLIPHNFTPGNLSVTSVSVQQGRGPRTSPHAYSRKSTYASITYDLSADLTPLWDWNTKQVFVYLYADYSSPSTSSSATTSNGNGKGKKDRVVIWDRIVRRKRDGRIRISGGKNKYGLKDPSDRFERNTTAVFKLGYDVMPYTGLLQSGTAAESVEVVFPSSRS